jgi:general secretion pathway protein M
MKNVSTWTRDPRARRTLAIVLAATVLLALIGAVAAPAWFLHQRYDEEIERLERSYRAYQRAFLARPQTIERLEAVKSLDASNLYLKATNPSLATAELQDKVSAIFNGNNARILTTQVPPPRDEGRFKQIIVNVQGYANAPNLRKMLVALETSQPLIFLDNFSVRSQVPFNYRGQPGVEPDMFVTFDAMAYMMQEPRVATPAKGAPQSGKPDTKPDGKAGAPVGANATTTGTAASAAVTQAVAAPTAAAGTAPASATAAVAKPPPATPAKVESSKSEVRK